MSKAEEIIELFEDFLREREINVPTSDEQMLENHDTFYETGNTAVIYGTDYGELKDGINEILKEGR